MQLNNIYHLREVTLSCGPFHICSFQFGEASIVVKMLDEVALALVHENGTLVQFKDSSLPFDLLQNLVTTIGGIDDLVRFVIGRTYADMLGGEGSEAIMTMIEPLLIYD